MRIFKQTVIHVVSPLILGGLLYISFRSLSLRMFTWFEIIGLQNLILNIRNTVSPLKVMLPNWIYYSLPDGLWVYSLSSALLILWDNKYKKGKYWLAIPLAFGVIIELAQSIKLFPGTFDIIDIFICSLALLLSIKITKSNSLKNAH